MRPFATVVATPSAVDADYGSAHRQYDGFQELAYLHPNRFEPSRERLRRHGVEPDDRYFVCRFRRWDALHDVGEAGLSPAGKRQLVSRLAEHGTVYITSSAPLPPDLAPYEQPVPPSLLHDLLACADVYAGDSGTTATEAAVLGTPAVRMQSAAAGEDFGTFVELEDKYGLLRSTADEDVALSLVESLATDPDATTRWQRRRTRLLSENIDVVPYVRRLLGDSERPSVRVG